MGKSTTHSTNGLSLSEHKQCCHSWRLHRAWIVVATLVFGVGILGPATFAVDPPDKQAGSTIPKRVTAAKQRPRVSSPPKATFDAVFVKPSTSASGSSDHVYAWEFVPKSNITVTHLGVYDHKLDGLNWPHQVGIWDVNDPKTPLVNGVVPRGSQAPLAGTFRLIPTKRVNLEAGKSYTVAAHYTDSSDWCVNLLNPSGEVIEYASQLDVRAYRYAFPHKQLSFPTASVKDDLKGISIGPTFRFEMR